MKVEMFQKEMTGRLKSGLNLNESTKCGIRLNDRYQVVSYPVVYKGSVIDSTKIELQRVGEMNDGGRSRSKNQNDWPIELQTYLLSKGYHIDHLGNVYPNKKASRLGVPNSQATQLFVEFQDVMFNLIYNN